LFDGFETLDAFGPVEIISKLNEIYRLNYFSFDQKTVTAAQWLNIKTVGNNDINTEGILLVPGGMGTRGLVNDREFLEKLENLADKAEYVLSVCTGSALLAKCGFLDNKMATTNKLAYDWATSQSNRVIWQKSARWVADGNVYTSSGVSAGMDMVLGFVHDMHGEDTARKTAERIEYIWNSDKDNDPFSVK
jgi:transcriptional regulator GlxA family with amidase domain